MELNEFIDKVKATSVNAVDMAKDTTKRLVTINDLKSKIRGYNNDKNKLFTQMGMDVYLAEKQGRNMDEAISEFVSNIDIINARIKNLQEKLELLNSSESNKTDSDEKNILYIEEKNE